MEPNLCVSEPKTWEVLRGQVREIAELFPDISGLRTAIQGADSDFYFCHCDRCQRLSKTQRAEMFLRHFTEGLDQGSPGKKLIFRTYMGA